MVEETIVAEKWWIQTGEESLGIFEADVVSAYPIEFVKSDLFGSLIGHNVKIKIVINTAKVHVSDSGKMNYSNQRSSEVWSGEFEILEEEEYLTKISIIGEGVPHPICDIPFALGIGHWRWIPAVNEPPEL